MMVAPWNPVDDLAPAAWVIERIKGFAVNVGSVVPTGFAAYARVLHPAYREGDEADWHRHPSVTWAEVARANGRVLHPEAQFGSLVGWVVPQGHEQPDIWDDEPDEGTLPEDVAYVLAEVLGRHTTTCDRCWFAVWDGWGDLEFPSANVPTFHLPHRDYFLFAGPVSAATQSFGDQRWYRSANLWWPDDRAWCVATEVDFDTTYVGGSEACIAALLATENLEVLPAEVSHGITAGGDQVNPVPAED